MTISADGRIVVFASHATNLVPGDTTHACGSLCLRPQDRQDRAGDGELRRGSGQQRLELPPGLSADGRFVVFVSTATNLVAGDTNNADDVFVRDRRNGTTERVNVSSSGAQSNAESFIGGDLGRRALRGFCVESPTHLCLGTFPARMTSSSATAWGNKTKRVIDDIPSGNPSISANGRFIAFSGEVPAFLRTSISTIA